MVAKFYDRTILTLEVLKGSQFVKPHLLSILKSPLELAQKIIGECFTRSGEGLLSYRDNLDSIKLMALGLSSANRSALSGDSLANYGVYQYALHQFFQSSIRARQGNVLDKALGHVLKNNGFTLYGKKQHEKVLSQIGIQPISKHDIDVFGSLGNRYMIAQIRSRDDTGGTTAKGSLVDLVRDIKGTLKFPTKPVDYLVYIWEPLERQQKGSLISRIGDALELSRSQRTILGKGRSLNYGTNIYLRVVYGSPELFRAIKSAYSVSIDVKDYDELVDQIGQWDDLWLSYALATLELEKLLIAGVTNFSILDELLESEGIVIGETDLLNYRKSSSSIAQHLAVVWRKDTIPFSPPADQLSYIRDIVLLKMAYIALQKG